jgi:hypothetical protein
MNHNPSDNSANVTPSGLAVVDSPADRLNPLLQQALGCLDIKLEDELTRFRSSPADPAPDLPSVQPTSVIWENQTADFDADAEILTAEIVQPELSRSQLTDDDNPPTGGFIIIDGITTTASSRNAITTVNYAPHPDRPESISAMHERLDLNFSSGGEIAPFHNEYLSSSQELLRQIQSGYAPPTDAAENRPQSSPAPAKRKYLTPLKLGSMAAICLIAGGAAYTYFNPSILAPLTATKTISPTATTNSLGQSIQSPNLAANEFTDLNLSTLNTIKLPTTATATNISTAPTTMTATPTAATTPVAIPFNGINPQIAPPTTITAQPRLADSLVRSLLPPNFHSIAKPSGYRTIQPNVRR